MGHKGIVTGFRNVVRGCRRNIRDVKKSVLDVSGLQSETSESAIAYTSKEEG